MLFDIFKKKPKTPYDAFMNRAKKLNPFDIDSYTELVEIVENTDVRAEEKTFGKKLIVISDTHGYLDIEGAFEGFMQRVEEYDLCILLGDIYPYEIDKILEFIPAEKIIALLGNHDEADLYERYGIKNINGTVYEHDGVTFAGIEGSFRYKNEEFPSYTQYESLLISEELGKADILLSHDMMFTGKYRDRAHCGLAGVTSYVYKNAPVYHIHGHTHKPYEAVYKNGTKEKSIYHCRYIEI